MQPFLHFPCLKLAAPYPREAKSNSPHTECAGYMKTIYRTVRSIPTPPNLSVSLSLRPSVPPSFFPNPLPRDILSPCPSTKSPA
jgi:hypothetical protein